MKRITVLSSIILCVIMLFSCNNETIHSVGSEDLGYTETTGSVSTDIVTEKTDDTEENAKRSAVTENENTDFETVSEAADGNEAEETAAKLLNYVKYDQMDSLASFIRDNDGMITVAGDDYGFFAFAGMLTVEKYLGGFDNLEKEKFNVWVFADPDILQNKYIFPVENLPWVY